MITKKALSHIESLKSKIPEVAKDAIFENAEFIISLLQDNQLSLGKDSYGKYINSGGVYNGFYKRSTEDFYAKDPYNRPRQPKIAGQPYNMEWTGEFFDSMNIKVDANDSRYEIFSSTGKDRFLEQIYGTELTDLNQEQNDWVNKNIIEPYLASWISSQVFDISF